MKSFIITGLLILFFACNGSSDNSLDPVLKALSNDVNKDSLLFYAKTLSDFKTRQFDREEKILARNWIKGKLEHFGYEVNFQEFSFGSNTGFNIIAEKKGTASSNGYILMDAHYDSRAHGNSASDEIAPGANDNGSGVSILLEAARLFKNRSTKETIRFVFFDGEELGLLGSNYYADSAKESNEKIKFVYNLDMVGGFEGMTHNKIVCEEDQSRSNTENNKPSAELNKELVDVMKSYTNLETYVDMAYASDYEKFEDHGYVIIGLYEYRGQEDNPHYHKSTDNFENLNKAYFYQVAKGAIAFLGKKSGLSD